MDMLLLAGAAALSVPVLVLAVEVAAAVGFGATVSRGSPSEGMRPRLAVLVPAHNEGRGILPTVADIRAQLQPGDQLLVIADNCSDDTARVAREAGAEVIERHDLEQRGKGYALACGVRHLERDSPEVVIVIDADCRLGEGALATLAVCCSANDRPAQAQNLMKAPPDAQRVDYKFAEFAWLIRNHVRPLGLAAMGLPCNVRGTGMALPWQAVCSVDLGSSKLVQDAKLGIDLAKQGHGAVYCPLARIESLFPQSTGGTLAQRQRWELGSLQIIRKEALRLFFAALLRRDLGLLALALDTLVPPVAFLGGMLLLGLAVSGGAALLGASAAAAALFASAIALLAGSILAAWARFGRGALPARDAVHALPFLLQKLQIYKPLLMGQKTGWTRTHRD